MARMKKFGTFGGVFTPSILTILGVIMYLRFPSIIGQAGLINTIGIVIIAHIISMTTSLSVASLSTDKPVQTGGTYFMISRSLGLPIGGTLGLALFVGLSLSVSLYLIGFAESFLQYWDMDTSIHSIRITGTIVLIAVTTITFISTSLAIKSQYFIMVAIGLSLLSIFLGKHEFQPTSINWEPLADAAPFMLLFGIFFPAVTGFEAGVSMSGDLQNPRKSLPLGAMLAVGVGFVVYIGLAFFYSSTVDAQALVNDPQILFKISLVPVLVIAGIWGATLSSALGSILGAPRILQAIAMDKIAPKVFAKGTGQSNEPRNALLLAFVIAEAGILIGELDVIARIVSMFFITTYAFLNLASVIESWASSDFRPAFKVPRIVSIIGTLSAFFVMILLDFLALAGATIVLGLLYLTLQRKELILETGDAWSSFWTNLAKRALLNLSKEKTNKRNWQPNIILFSGGEQARPYLLEMGTALTGKLGALTDFTLLTAHESPQKKTTLPASLKQKSSYFKREFKCESIEDGINSITRVYGFSGFEPNTILMGWSKSSGNVDFFCRILDDFKAKKFNAAFLDYDQTAGFGRKEKIDIWWNGKGRHLSFALSILKFLQFDPSWRDAQLRILIINTNSAITDRLYRDTNELLGEKRIKAQVKVISDEFGARSQEAIISEESAESDLIVIGLSQKSPTYTNQYIQSVNHISRVPASVLILSPSAEFEEINLVDASDVKGLPDTSQAIRTKPLLPIPVISNPVVKLRLEKLDVEYQQMLHHFYNNTIQPSMAQLNSLVTLMKDHLTQSFEHLNKELNDNEPHEIPKTLNRYHQSFLIYSNNLIGKKFSEITADTKKTLMAGIADILAQTGNHTYEAPESILLSYPVPASKKYRQVEVRYRKQLNFYLKSFIVPEIKKQLGELETLSVHLYNDFRKTLFSVNDTYEKAILRHKNNNTLKVVANNVPEELLQPIQQRIANYLDEALYNLLSASRKMVIQLNSDLSSFKTVRASHRKIKQTPASAIDYLNAFADNWNDGITLINNAIFLDSRILSNRKISKSILQKTYERLLSILSDALLKPIDQLVMNIEIAQETELESLKPAEFQETIRIQHLASEAYLKITELIEDIPDEIVIPQSLFNDALPVQLETIFPVSITLRRITENILDTHFYEAFYRGMEQLAEVVNRANMECKEAQSMFLFSLKNTSDNNTNQADAAFNADILFKKLIDNTRNEKKNIESAIQKTKLTATDALDNAFSKLFYHSIMETDKSANTIRRQSQSKRLTTSVRTKLEDLKSSLNQYIIYGMNAFGRSLEVTDKQALQAPLKHSQVGQILSVVLQTLPEKKIQDHVPVYYRTLFSSRSKINDEFWIARHKEMEQIKWALQRHREGFGNAVAITGIHGAGKTTLSAYAANHLFKKTHTIWIKPPPAGSVQLEDFLTALTTNQPGFDSIDAFFDHLPYESAVIINDLELWWERSLEGYAVIEKIMNCMREYSHKLFFIVNCNVHFFNLLNHYMPLQDSFTTIIHCGGFDAGQLQSLIMNRHKSSGLNMYYKGKHEEKLSQLDLSILFNTLRKQSKGIPGIAINIWKANIIKASTASIHLRKPVAPITTLLQQIDPDWLVVIALYIQHKTMTIEKLVRITDLSHTEITNLTEGMRNAGIITEKAQNTYALGRNIEPYFTEICIEKGII